LYYRPDVVLDFGGDEYKQASIKSTESKYLEKYGRYDYTVTPNIMLNIVILRDRCNALETST